MVHVNFIEASLHILKIKALTNIVNTSNEKKNSAKTEVLGFYNYFIMNKKGEILDWCRTPFQYSIYVSHGNGYKKYRKKKKSN